MNDPKTQRVRVDGYTRVMLTAIAVLLTLMVVGLWADGGPRARPAEAAKPFANTAEQREAITNSLGQTNAKLDELIALMRSGDAKVRIVGTAKAAKGSEDADETDESDEPGE